MKRATLLLVVFALLSVFTVNGQHKKSHSQHKKVNVQKKKESRRQNNADEQKNSKNKVFNVDNVSFTMIYVRGGDCVLGETTDQGGIGHKSGNYFEQTPTPVLCNLSSFYIGQTCVTQELWEAVMGENPSKIKGAKFPVTDVSWDDCMVFITRLNSKTGEKFRLPTEWEWEYAARGGQESKYYKYSGGNNFDEVGHDDSNYSVGSKKPNELGIYEMSGYPCEWCRNYYYSIFEGGENPQGEHKSNEHAVRGGRLLPICYRMHCDPAINPSTYGLRILLPVKRVVIEED